LYKTLIGEVFEENYNWFKRFLRARFINLNDYDIEDIIQHTALKLLYMGENIGGIKSLTSYVYSALSNGAKDHFKKTNRELLTAEHIEESTVTLEEEVLKRELKKVIYEAINSLSEKQKYVFIETEIKGRSYNELVRETGEKLGTLLSRKNRTLKKLQKIICDYVKKEIKNG
jgi:RNA polymerase sporulation-specific sigma factor